MLIKILTIIMVSNFGSSSTSSTVVTYFIDRENMKDKVNFCNIRTQNE